MADNVAITAGSGTTIATDDVGSGVQVQRMKATWGPDGTANDTDVASGKPLPIQIRQPDGVAGQGYSATVSFTTGTTAYAANDCVGASAANSAVQFSTMGPSSAEILITSASLEIDSSSIISGETSYRLYLYNVTPPSALNDSVAWDLPSGDRASFLGFVDLGAIVDLGSTLYCEVNGINKQIKLSSANLFAYLTTIGAFTPTARVNKITLHSVAV